jgi:hypothetical protein
MTPYAKPGWDVPAWRLGGSSSAILLGSPGLTSTHSVLTSRCEQRDAR